MSSAPSSPPKPIPKVLNFVFGGSAGMLASTVVHPMDVLKNRMQLADQAGKKTTVRGVFSSVMKNQGIGGMYKGLTASLLRQATYTTTRLGVYNWLLEVAKSPDGTPASFSTKAGIGVFAGICGAFVGTPAELCLIRMTADGRLPPAERRNYTHVGNALVRIVREEGVFTLWRGCIPTVVRACVVNASQLATYSQVKQMLLTSTSLKDDVFTHLVSSLTAVFVTSVTSLPIDILKTRIQYMRTINGVPEYKGAMDALVKIVQNEGVFALSKGFVPYFSRNAPHTIMIFVFLEQFSRAYRSYCM